MGTVNALDIPETIKEEACTGLADLMQVDAGKGRVRELNVSLFSGLIQASCDPDVALGSWAAGFTPLGIVNAIPCFGIFPTLENSAPTGTLDEVEALIPWTEGQGNYASFLEHAELVEVELRKRDK